jgi:hypothetical protein
MPVFTVGLDEGLERVPGSPYRNRQRLRVSILESRLRGSVTTALASSAGQRMWRETLTVWVMSPDHRDDGPTGLVT